VSETSPKLETCFNEILQAGKVKQHQNYNNFIVFSFICFWTKFSFVIIFNFQRKTAKNFCLQIAED